MSSPALSLRNLEVRFRRAGAEVTVVDGISFDLQAGAVTALVGESGCGKSVTARALMGLLDPRHASVTADCYRLGDRDLSGFDSGQWHGVRGRGVAMVFQDPGAALDPVFTIGQQLRLVIRRCGQSGPERELALAALRESGFEEPRQAYDAYPHQLSGGMRQLAMIAMAMVARPRVLIADEPTTALDVTTQALVIERLAALARLGDSSVLLVTHDLGVAARLCTDVMVMYCGRLVESGNYRSLFHHPRHPYTAGLLAAVPRIDPLQPTPRGIPGRVPALSDRTSGCRFAPRCDRADQTCRDHYPAMTQQGSLRVACHHPR